MVGPTRSNTLYPTSSATASSSADDGDEISIMEIGDIVTLQSLIPASAYLIINSTYSIASAGSKTTSGSRGLGLHIVKTLVVQHGGGSGQ